MSEDFITLLEEFEKEKGISREILIDALETTFGIKELTFPSSDIKTALE